VNYYNEHDPKAAAWLRELIAQGHIPPGDVDERSIVDIRPHEIARYTQQHFFAGIGGWSLALQLAGWPTDRPVRTGSCPCQPFSAAGKGLGTKDARHLWPVFRDIITFGDLTVTFGEQVASKAGRHWLDGVRADLEGLGYAVGAADLCAAGVNAPHIRQRLYWVADPNGWKRDGFSGRKGRESHRTPTGWEQSDGKPELDRSSCGLAHANSDGRTQYERESWDNSRRQAGPPDSTECGGDSRGMGDSNLPGCCEQSGAVAVPQEQPTTELRGNLGHWSAFDLIPCRDGKARRVEPGTFPLAHGVPARMGRLRGYGNAIVPQVAAEFIAAYMDTLTV